MPRKVCRTVCPSASFPRPICPNALPLSFRKAKRHPAKRKLEEDLVAGLLFQQGVEVTVIPNLYDLAPDGTGMLCLQGIAGDMVLCSWLFPRAAHWILERNGIHGQIGKSLLKSAGDEDDEDEEDETPEANAETNGEVGNGESSSGNGQAADKSHVGLRHASGRTIYCLDLRTHEAVQPYLDEIARIQREATTETVSLMGWINGSQSLNSLSDISTKVPGFRFQVPT